MRQSVLGITLDADNEWIKLAKLIPWHQFEEEYASSLPYGTSQPACSFRMALGSLLIKERYQFSDEEMVINITMNPCLQYFIGLEQERYLEWLESGERGDIVRRFGINKRCYSLGCITAKLQHKSEVMILMSVLTLNLQRRLRLLLHTFFRIYYEPQILLLMQ